MSLLKYFQKANKPELIFSEFKIFIVMIYIFATWLLTAENFLSTMN